MTKQFTLLLYGNWIYETLPTKGVLYNWKNFTHLVKLDNSCHE